MFGKLKNIFGGSNDLSIPAPVAGTAIPLSEVSDPTFSQGILGKGCAIRPSSGRVVAPVDATVSMIFETGHAVSLELSGDDKAGAGRCYDSRDAASGLSSELFHQ